MPCLPSHQDTAHQPRSRLRYLVGVDGYEDHVVGHLLVQAIGNGDIGALTSRGHDSAVALELGQPDGAGTGDDRDLVASLGQLVRERAANAASADDRDGPAERSG
jgi:hypothetical protein